MVVSFHFKYSYIPLIVCYTFRFCLSNIYYFRPINKSLDKNFGFCYHKFDDKKMSESWPGIPHINGAIKTFYGTILTIFRGYF